MERRVSRFEESFAIVRRLLAGERVTFEGRYFTTDDAVLLPKPARPVPLMAGSIGPRMLGIMLPHVQVWNTWYTWYGNTADGFRELNANDRRRGRGGRPRPARDRAQRLRPRRARLRGGQAPARRGHGARSRSTESARCSTSWRRPVRDEAILVLRPITEESIRSLGETLALA